MLGKGFARFIALVRAVVCDAEPVISFSQLRLAIDGLCVQRNRGGVVTRLGPQIA